MPKIELYLTPAGYGSKIKIDGRELEHCKSLTIKAEAGKVTTVQFEVLALDGIDLTVENAETIETITDIRRNSLSTEEHPIL